jgi:hypothetical protein
LYIGLFFCILYLLLVGPRSPNDSIILTDFAFRLWPSRLWPSRLWPSHLWPSPPPLFIGHYSCMLLMNCVSPLSLFPCSILSFFYLLHETDRGLMIASLFTLSNLYKRQLFWRLFHLLNYKWLKTQWFWLWFWTFLWAVWIHFFLIANYNLTEANLIIAPLEIFYFKLEIF